MSSLSIVQSTINGELFQGASLSQRGICRKMNIAFSDWSQLSIGMRFRIDCDISIYAPVKLYFGVCCGTSMPGVVGATLPSNFVGMRNVSNNGIGHNMTDGYYSTGGHEFVYAQNSAFTVLSPFSPGAGSVLFGDKNHHSFLLCTLNKSSNEFYLNNASGTVASSNYDVTTTQMANLIKGSGTPTPANMYGGRTYYGVGSKTYSATINTLDSICVVWTGIQPLIVKEIYWRKLS